MCILYLINVYVNCVVTLFRLHASCFEYNNHNNNYDNDSVNYYINDDATTYIDITVVVYRRQFNIITRVDHNRSYNVDSGNYDAVDSTCQQLIFLGQI